jgi:hypothetical protein
VGKESGGGVKGEREQRGKRERKERGRRVKREGVEEERESRVKGE